MEYPKKLNAQNLKEFQTHYNPHKKYEFALGQILQVIALVANRLRIKYVLYFSSLFSLHFNSTVMESFLLPSWTH